MGDVAIGVRLAHATEEFFRDREFSVVTDLTMFFVVTEETLSRHASLGLLSRQSFPCHDKVPIFLCRDRACGWLGGVTTEHAPNVHHRKVCAL